MLELNTIMVPLDFSERSRTAVDQAMELASHFDSNLVLAHAVPSGEPAVAYSEAGPFVVREFPSPEQLAAQADLKMDEIIASVKPDRPVAKLILEGDPATAIAEHARDNDIGLIVMPTHGYGVFRRFVLGSVTTKVLHDVQCPVMTGAHVQDANGFRQGPFKKVACALDLEPGSESVLTWAWEFANAYDAELTVLHAAPQVEIGGLYGEWLPPQTLRMMLDCARERVEALMDRVECEGRVEVMTAAPAGLVRKYVEENPTDVLIMGRSPEGGLIGKLGAHAYAIVRESPCPVISV